MLIFSMNEDSHPERNKAELSTVAERERRRASRHMERGKRPDIRAAKLKTRTWTVDKQRLLWRCVQGVPQGPRIGKKEQASETEGGEERASVHHSLLSFPFISHPGQSAP